MIIPAPLFFLVHVYTTWLLARPFPAAYVTPILVYGAVQALAEHFADMLPTLARFAPLLGLPGLVIAGFHYRIAYKQMADKARCWCGIAGYVLILGMAKGFDVGIPKDDPAEQAAALQDPAYSAQHAALHAVLIPIIALTAYAVPSPHSAAAKAVTKAD